MAINVQSRNFELLAADEQYLQKKLAKLGRLMPVDTDDVLIQVSLDKRGGKKNADDLYGADIRTVNGAEKYAASSRSKDLRKAIDKAEYHLRREIIQGRGKRRSAMRRGTDKLGQMFRDWSN